MDLPQSRLDSLFNDFTHLKELNPDGYRANTDTWKEYLMSNYLIGSKSVIFHCGSDLLRKLSREPYGPPKSIDLALNCLVESGYLVTKDDFYNGVMYPRQKSTLLRWIGLTSKSRNRFDSRKNNGVYYLKDTALVTKPVLERTFERIKSQIENNIISRATGITDLIFSKNDFYRKAGFHRILIDSEEEREIMLFYLDHYKGLIVRDDEIIKVVAPEVAHFVKDCPRKITEDDHRIAALEGTLAYLNSQVKAMRSQSSDYISMLNDAISKSAPRDIQKEYLKGKRISEMNLTRLLNYQNKLLAIKGQLNMASTNALLVSTLKDSKEVLKSINEYAGSAEKVAELLGEIKEQGAKADEINDLLSSSAFAEDDSQLDIELERLKEEGVTRQVTSGKTSEQPNTELEESSQELLMRLKNLEISDRPKPDAVVQEKVNPENEREKHPVAET